METQIEIKKKHPGGRPRKTTDDLPKNWESLIIKWASKGLSEVEMRAKLCMLGGKFSHETWYALKEREIKFSETIIKAKALSEAWWINKARTSLKSKTFQTGCWYACMKNMFGWRDKTETEVNMNFTAKTILEAVNIASKTNRISEHV